MALKDCLTEEEKKFRQQHIQPSYKRQKDDGWGDNGEVMAFFCFRLWHEVQRLRSVLQKKNIDPGPDQHWFEIPPVGPGTHRPGTLAGKSSH